MNLHRTPLPVPEAVRKVMEYTKEGKAERVTIEHSYGRMLAEDIKATTLSPYNN